MKFSSFLLLLFILATFVVVQGWLLHTKLMAKRVITAQAASIESVTVEIRSPVSGLIESVNVQEGQLVRQGQLLLTILIPSPIDPTVQTTQQLTAPLDGVITDYEVLPNVYTCCGEVLMKVVDTRLAAMYIEAQLPVAPERLAQIRPGLRATMRAGFLGEDVTVPLQVATVDPVYDGTAGTIGVTLRLPEGYQGLTSLPPGVPVAVMITTGEPGTVEHFLFGIKEKVLTLATR